MTKPYGTGRYSYGEHCINAYKRVRLFVSLLFSVPRIPDKPGKTSRATLELFGIGCVRSKLNIIRKTRDNEVVFLARVSRVCLSRQGMVEYSSPLFYAYSSAGHLIT